MTCAVYSGNGDAIVASYNDDDIYLFDTTLSEAADATHKYSGHRNNATGVLIKFVCLFVCFFVCLFVCLFVFVFFFFFTLKGYWLRGKKLSIKKKNHACRQIL